MNRWMKIACILCKQVSSSFMKLSYRWLLQFVRQQWKGKGKTINETLKNNCLMQTMAFLSLHQTHISMIVQNNVSASLVVVGYVSATKTKPSIRTKSYGYALKDRRFAIKNKISDLHRLKPTVMVTKLHWVDQFCGWAERNILRKMVSWWVLCHLCLRAQMANYIRIQFDGVF